MLHLRRRDRFAGQPQAGGRQLLKKCAAKLSPWFSDRRQSTVEEIKEQLAYRETNQEKVAAFYVARTLDESTKVLLDGPQAMPRARGGIRSTAGPRPGIRPGMTGRPPMGGMDMRGGVWSNADEVRVSVEYRQYEEMGNEIREALLQVRQEARLQRRTPMATVSSAAALWVENDIVNIILTPWIPPASRLPL